MNRQTQPQPAPAAVAQTPQPAATPIEAHKLAESLMEIMNELLSLIERETALVRAGNLREAMKFTDTKAELSRRYRSSIMHLQTSQPYLAQATPELLSVLHRNHDIFRAMLQVNLTVLATAHAVSEGIVRGVNAEMQRRNIPRTYTAFGKRAVPGPRHMRPIMVSRSL